MSIAQLVCVFVTLGSQACNPLAPHFRPGPALLYNIFPHYTARLPKKVIIEHKMCILIFPTILSEKFVILRRNERDTIKIVYWSSCKVP
jgi:hypothetical protein